MLGPTSEVWADGLLDLDEVTDAMIKLADSSGGAVSAQQKEAVLKKAHFAYEQERQAAMSDMHSKKALAYHVEKLLGGMGCAADEVRATEPVTKAECPPTPAHSAPPHCARAAFLRCGRRWRRRSCASISCSAIARTASLTRR